MFVQLICKRDIFISLEIGEVRLMKSGRIEILSIVLEAGRRFIIRLMSALNTI
jgi:hypothetical protein